MLEPDPVTTVSYQSIYKYETITVGDRRISEKRYMIKTNTPFDMNPENNQYYLLAEAFAEHSANEPSNIHYYENGNIKAKYFVDAESNFYNTEHYYENGGLAKVEQVKNGEVVEYTVYDENGNITEQENKTFREHRKNLTAGIVNNIVSLVNSDLPETSNGKAFIPCMIDAIDLNNGFECPGDDVDPKEYMKTMTQKITTTFAGTASLSNEQHNNINNLINSDAINNLIKQLMPRD